VNHLTQAIKEYARQIGFSLVGVTSSSLLPHAEVFEAWLEQEQHGEMAYLSTERSRYVRPRPDLLMPGCRSILVLATRYPAPVLSQPGSDHEHALRGRIAAYAWGEDYHVLLAGKMRTLVMFIENQVGHPISSRWYTDTGPVLERELAQRAGLGWIGKNTCLINPAGGSYYFLAEILLDLDLEPDQPFVADRCGTCHRCMEACPTGCILPNRILDARRCISYLTIELKGAIPPELRSMLDGWIFGCDICQQVCPWNRFAKNLGSPLFDQQLADPAPSLLMEMDLSSTAFNRKYLHSPLRRTKRRGYLRNIAVAMGNLGVMEAVPGLSEVIMHESEPLVRSHAAWALGKLANPASKKVLEQALDSETDPQVRSEILSALEEIT
jgi:epoxyqueuosine reductase